MAYIYPLNNPGSVHLTVFDFTYLSPPPTLRLDMCRLGFGQLGSSRLLSSFTLIESVLYIWTGACIALGSDYQGCVFYVF